MNTREARNSDIFEAQREVERAKHDLAVQLRLASRSGKQMVENTLQRTVQNAKPLLIATAALGAAAFLLGIFKSLRRRPRRAGWMIPRPVPPPRSPSLIGTIFRSALASAAASLAARLMERLSKALEPPSNSTSEQGSSVPQAAGTAAGAASALTSPGRSDL